jgi:hypothetical protein
VAELTRPALVARRVLSPDRLRRLDGLLDPAACRRGGQVAIAI